MDNWISLEDQLPKHGQKVDLWVVNKDNAYRFVNWSWERQDTLLHINGYKATHWMPVPEPPKPSHNG